MHDATYVVLVSVPKPNQWCGTWLCLKRQYRERIITFLGMVPVSGHDPDSRGQLCNLTCRLDLVL